MLRYSGADPEMFENDWGGEMKYLWDPSGSAKGYYKLMINHIVTPCA